MFSGALGTIAQALITNGDALYVVVDNTFMNMSEKAQMAILAHELGHKKCGHPQKITDMGGWLKYTKKRNRKAKRGDVHQFEIEADMYACNFSMDWTEWWDGMVELKPHLSKDGVIELSRRLEYIRMMFEIIPD